MSRTNLLPEGWKLSRLGRLTTKVGSGITPKGGRETYLDSGIPFIRSQNVLEGRLDLSDVAYLSATKHQEMSNSIVRPRDVLLNITGASIGRCARVPADFAEANVNQHVCIIRPNESLDPEFLTNLLNSWIGKRLIYQSQAGGNREGLNYEQIRAFQILIPPLSEQQKIAAILSTWDRAIELTEKLIAAKQKRKQALFAKFFSKQQNSHSPNAKNEDRRVEIGKLVRKRFEKSCDLDKYPLHSFTIEDGVTQKTDRYERSFLLRDAENNGYSVVHFGDFVINPMNLRFGAIGRSQVRFPVTVSAYYDVFYIVDSNCDPIYLEYLLKSPFLMHTYERVSAGSLIEKKRVHFSEFGKIRIELPSLPEQKRISVILGVMDRELRLLTLKREQLLQQKKGLMQQLLTGKVRVNVDTKAIREAVT